MAMYCALTWVTECDGCGRCCEDSEEEEVEDED